MASKSVAFGIQFYDNDGELSWFAHSQCAGDLQRLYRMDGKWFTRWRVLKFLWRAFWSLESMRPKNVSEDKG